MVVVWGTQLYGRVDQMPGGFQVATRFFYLQFVPLVPTATYLIVAEQGEQFNGVKIKMSLRSVLFAWLRAALVTGGLVLAVVALIAGIGGKRRAGDVGMATGAGVGAVLCFVGVPLTFRLSRATPARAAAIAAANGLPPELFAGQFPDEPEGEFGAMPTDTGEELPDGDAPPPPPPAKAEKAEDDLDRRARGE